MCPCENIAKDTHSWNEYTLLLITLCRLLDGFALSLPLIQFSLKKFLLGALYTPGTTDQKPRSRPGGKTKSLREKSHLVVGQQWALQTERSEKTTGKRGPQSTCPTCWEVQAMLETAEEHTGQSHQVQRPQGARRLTCLRTSKRAMWLGWSRGQVLRERSLSHSAGKKAGSREEPDPAVLKREH